MSTHVIRRCGKVPGTLIATGSKPSSGAFSAQGRRTTKPEYYGAYLQPLFDRWRAARRARCSVVGALLAAPAFSESSFENLCGVSNPIELEAFG
jgi:hypothetical protein